MYVVFYNAHMTEQTNPTELTRIAVRPTLDVPMDHDPESEGGGVAVAEKKQEEDIVKILAAKEKQLAQDIAQVKKTRGTSEEDYKKAIDSWKKAVGGRSLTPEEMLAAASGHTPESVQQIQQHQQEAPKEQKVDDSKSLFEGMYAQIDELLTHPDPNIAIIQAQLEKNEDVIFDQIWNRFPDKATNKQKEMEYRNLFKETDPRTFLLAYKTFVRGIEAQPIISDEDLEKVAPKEKKDKKESETGEELESTPRSLQDLCEWIILTDSKKLWGRDGDFPLLKERKDAKGRTLMTTIATRNGPREVPQWEVNHENFLLWFRSKSLEVHFDNSTDPLSPLTAVAIETQFRTVNLIQMKMNKQQYFSDKYNDQVYDNLYNQIINEAWLFGVTRNNDLGYRQIMNQDEKLADAILQLNAKQEYTRGDNFEFRYRMPDRIVRRLRNTGDSSTVLEEQYDSKVGDAMRYSNDIYRHFADIKWLREFVGEDSPLMTLEGFKDAIRLVDGLPAGAPVGDDHPALQIVNKETGEIRKIFENGKLNEKNFLQYINFWDTQTPDDSKLKVARELVRLSVARRYDLKNGLDDPEFTTEELAKKKTEFGNTAYGQAQFEAWRTEKMHDRNVRRTNLMWAEESAYLDQRWTGQAAHNDITKKGFDAFAKLSLEQYLLRQSGEGTAGPIGNPEQLGVFKNLGLDLYTGIKTESGLTPYEILEELEVIDKNISDIQRRVDMDPQQKDALLARLYEDKVQTRGKLRFPANTQLDYSSNHVSRAFQIYHEITGAEQLGLDKIVTKNLLIGGVKYNRAEFEARIKDGFIKRMRYAFKSNTQIDYGAMIRGLDMLEARKGNWVFKDMTVAEYMFGDEVLEDFIIGEKEKTLKVSKWNPETKKNEEVTANFDEYVRTTKFRDEVLKKAARARIAAELRDHRYRFGPSDRWGIGMVEKFIEALETMEAYEPDPDNPGRERPTGRTFFSHKDIEWIRERSGTQFSHMLKEETVTAVGTGALGGIGKALKVFFGSAFK